MRMILPFGIIVLIYLVTEFTFLYGIKKQIIKDKFKWKIILWLNFIILAGFIISFSILTYNIRNTPNFISFTKMFYALSYFMLLFIPKINFALFFLINQIIKFLLKRLKSNNLQFSFFSKIGIVISVLIFLGILYGITIGKNDLTLKTADIFSNRIPKSFDGLKIVQISDIHIGSFYYNKEKLIEVVKTINSLKPDIVLLTGDLVNNFAEEADGFDSILKKIDAPYGKFAVLGNHDFGDYTIWRTPETKNVNLKKIIFHYNEMGFKLLRNESEPIFKENDSIYIAGVDNWGLPPFKKYGNFEKATRNVPSKCYTIMLSHDPTHWNKEIKFYKKVDVTFSGHTHGMQFGFEKFGIKWSPVKYKYPQWAGLYQNKNSYLYVNRGLGCIGFLGRIGMPPEITVIILHKK